MTPPSALDLVRLGVMQDLLGALAHDLGQPLNVIRMLAENGVDVLESGAGAADAASSLGRIVEQAEQLDHMVRRLSLLLAPPQGQGADANGVVERVVATRADTFAREALHLRVDLPRGLGAVAATAVQVEHLAATFLDNARDAVLRARQNRAAGLVEIGCAAEGGGVRLFVRDDGDGMPVGVRERLSGVPAAGKRQLGLGLTVAVGIAAVLCGRIYIEHLQTGTCISAWLPLRSGTA